MPANNRSSQILGMPFGTACHNLRKLVLFNLAQKLKENVCFRCKQDILTVEEFTIDHKETWRNKGAELFWDINNIAFSHSYCNLPTGIVRREIVSGTLWCSKCKLFLEIERFSKDKKQRTGYSLICKDCSNSRRRKVKARGDCIHCGAVRGTKPFRVTHNICLACANRIYRSNSKRRKRSHVINQTLSSSGKINGAKRDD
ncbi:MAG: HNH endonuclease [Acidobacteria bacterium]|nr:HNH endonuclease [Acidobacteriota bacterium]